MRDIDQLLEDFFENNISVEGLQEQLDNQMQGLNRNQDAKQNRIAQKLYTECISERSPLDVLIEKERFKNIAVILERIRKKLPQEYWNIIVKRVIYRKTQEEIAKELGISQQAISKKITKIIDIASGLVSIKEYRECFVHESILEAESPKIKVKYPADAAFNSSTGKYSTCNMAKYLDNSFRDSKTICNSYCGKKCKNSCMKDRLGECI